MNRYGVFAVLALAVAVQSGCGTFRNWRGNNNDDSMHCTECETGGSAVERTYTEPAIETIQPGVRTYVPGPT